MAPQMCTIYGVGVSWYLKSLGDMDVIWTELRGMCMQDHTEECQRSKRCALKATTAAAAVSDSVCGLEFCGKGEILWI